MTVQPLGRSTFGDIKNIGNLMKLEEAKAILETWVQNEKLRVHMRQVAHLMKTWALEKEQTTLDEAYKWEIAGLLHDADWEKYPQLHCQKIIEHLEELNQDPDVLHAIASHSPRYFGVDPVTMMDKMIFAFDELSGFIHAYSLMRPDGYGGMEVSSIKKKLKDKTFAQGVDRQDIADACELSGVNLDELIEFIIVNQKNIS
jgi:predicted hydrolase (HD superfamily)